MIEKLFAEHELIDLNNAVKLNVDQMNGVEIEEWPTRIAEVAMWLIDHQMNVEASQRFGKPLVRLPLKKSAKIVNENSLRIDWNNVLPSTECKYILGNPPFVGTKHLTADQAEDVESIWGETGGIGLLDYVTCWYAKALRYIKDRNIEVAFVSTNSICQGEQAGELWKRLFAGGATINFAHRTFSWISEARGKAHVHVVIIGFGLSDRNPKKITEYADDDRPIVVTAKRINQYLVDGPPIIITNRPHPLCSSPEMGIGNKPIDDGQYLFDTLQRDDFLAREPGARRWMRTFFGADDYLYNKPRYCLWLRDCPPSELRKMPAVMERVEAVRKFRLRSKSGPTRKLAGTPTRFHVENIPNVSFLLIPRHSSEKRTYIPMGYLTPENLAGDSCLVISNASLYHFGVLSSAIHMAWVKEVCGRLESRYRYSNKLVYNNYPWPNDVGEKQTQTVENAAQAVLNARLVFPDQTLADLYDPLTMPKELRDAHRQLDRSVDRCYRAAPFDSDRQRVEFLFSRYEQLTTLYARKQRQRSKKH